MQGKELDSKIVACPFHFCIFYDSVTVWLCVCICHVLASTLSYLLVHFFDGCTRGSKCNKAFLTTQERLSAFSNDP